MNSADCSPTRIDVVSIDALRETRSDAPDATAVRRRSLETNPDDESAILALAQGELSAKNHDTVVVLATHGNALNPMNFDFLRVRAQAHYHRLEFAAAIADAEAVLGVVPDDALMAQVLLFSAIFSGDLVKAASAARSALERHPDHVAFLYFSCKAAQSEGKLDASLELVRRMLLLHPEFPEVHALAADCFMMAGRAPNARVHLEKTVELGGGNHVVFYHLGCIHLGDRNFEPALRHFLASIEAGRPGVDAHINAGYCYLGLDDPVQAREICDRAFAIGPVDLRSWELKLCVASAMSDDDAVRLATAEVDKAKAISAMR